MYRDETKNLLKLINLEDFSIISYLGEIRNPEYSVTGSNIYFKLNLTPSVKSIFYLGYVTVSSDMISGLPTTQNYYFRFERPNYIDWYTYKVYPIWADNTNVRNAENPYIPSIEGESVIYTGYSKLSASSAGLEGRNITLLFIPNELYDMFFS